MLKNLSMIKFEVEEYRSSDKKYWTAVSIRIKIFNYQWRNVVQILGIGIANERIIYTKLLLLENFFRN